MGVPFVAHENLLEENLILASGDPKNEGQNFLGLYPVPL